MKSKGVGQPEQSWKKIWSSRKADKNKTALSDLIEFDGFDTRAGEIKISAWRGYIKDICKRMNISKADSIFEAGCGAGAFLYLFYNAGHKVGGIDYSPSMVKMARTAMKGMDFKISSAIDMDTRHHYDFVFSNSVFMYFPDLSYAGKVVSKMVEKSKKKAAIFDIANLSCKKEAEDYKRQMIGEEEYNKKYKHLKRLYYSKDFFKKLGNKYGWDVEIYDQNIKNYKQSSFRFNVIFSK